MKTFILLFAFLFACTKTETITETETITTTETETRYDDRGLPTDRDYLTRSEWKGNHITSQMQRQRNASKNGRLLASQTSLSSSAKKPKKNKLSPEYPIR
jgi:hypothetical protein